MLKPYMVHAGAPEEDGAVLVFAHNSQQAKVTAWRECGAFMFDRYTDLRVNSLKGRDWLFSDCDKDKLRDGIPHSVIEPKTCFNCEQ